MKVALPICAAVVLNPTDPAGKFEAWPKRRLTAEAIRFGEEQVQKMLRDRPAMAKMAANPMLFAGGRGSSPAKMLV